MTATAKSPLRDLAESLNANLAKLNQVVSSTELTSQARRHLDARILDFVAQAEVLLDRLDPIHQPNFIFDPGDPSVVGRFIALAMIAQPRTSLSDLANFYGSGVYALYYCGAAASYVPISKTETPIYVGKANPKTETAKTPRDQGTRLFRRLNDHRRNIEKASSTLDIRDFECRVLVVQSGWQSAAEDYLISLFSPVWNNEADVCFGLGKHGDAPQTRANLRSPWDTLHPGRDWAWRDPNMGNARAPERIRADLAAHFTSKPAFRTADDLLRNFMRELQQL